MLIKTQGLGTATSGKRTWSEPYEIWVNPEHITSVLPEIRHIKLLGDADYIKLSEDGFERFVKAYEAVMR